MPYDEQVDGRIKYIVSEWSNTENKKMFGGVCHLINGNMFCGVYKDFLILRLGEKAAENTLKEAYTRPFDITGRPMKGWVMVNKKGFQQQEQLIRWLQFARDFALTLPPK